MSVPLPLWQNGDGVSVPPHASDRVAGNLRRWATASWAAFGLLTVDGRSDSGQARAEPETDLRRIAGRLARPALLGLLSTMAITYGASQFGSPFSLKVTGAWFFGVPSITTPPGRNVLVSLVCSYGGMLLLIRAWLDMLRTVSPSRSDQRPLPVAALAAVAALWVLPLLIGPPLFSQDVYSYAAQGAMVTQGINPYHHGPDALGVANAYYPYVDQLWGASPAPYGPVFMILDAGIVTLTGHHVLATVEGLRLLSLAGVILLGIFLPMLARSMGRDGGTVFTLAVLNPVVLLHLVAGAHNDALMLGLLVAGLAMAQRRRPVVGIVLCALAAMVKAPAAIGLVYIGWNWVGAGVPWRHRIRPLTTAGVIGAGVAAVVTAVTGLGWDWVKALDNPSVVRSVLDPVTALGMILGSITHLMHLPFGVSMMLHLTRTLGLLGALVACAWLLFNSDRIGVIKAIGLSLLVVVVLGPVVQPWYLAWGVVLLAPIGFGRWRPILVATTLVGSFIGFPGGYLLVQELARASLWSVALALAVLLAIPIPPLVTRIRAILAERQAVLAQLRPQALLAD